MRRTFLAKLCFDFMGDIIAIKLGFREQVAAEPLKMSGTEEVGFLDQIVRARLGRLENNLNWQGGLQES